MPLDPVGGSAPGPRQGLRPWTPLGALPPNSSQRSLRVAAKAASFNSLAHWASASLFPPLAALGSAPLPLLKKAGENQLENFFGFPAKYAGPPLMGSGGLVLFVGSRGRKGVADDSFGRQKTATARGGGGVWRPGAALRAAPGLPNKSAGPGAFGPGPRSFRALRAPPPPPHTPTPSPSPTPAHLRRPYGGCPWEAGGWDGPGSAFPQRQKAAKKEAVKPPPSRSVVFNMGP